MAPRDPAPLKDGGSPALMGGQHRVLDAAACVQCDTPGQSLGQSSDPLGSHPAATLATALSAAPADLYVPRHGVGELKAETEEQLCSEHDQCFCDEVGEGSVKQRWAHEPISGHDEEGMVGKDEQGGVGVALDVWEQDVPSLRLHRFYRCLSDFDEIELEE